uniref:Uncharacterized protein n=1 Tax=Chromera velia CCMP2878 TaxID=1169474 RepID=A0A0G4GEK0_9ALVE|eukprot:Cvel_21444.t1-p1 / transcript=Cvel_21444.t1 / gene=Cvel_21444 / organism=Chromera_velia_CCMP2878 / gene_product=hypothetical protein / transcript_product=hypothetical protein / location=Cvel_scaffold2011:8398-12292(+) / protein_length=214 / sequence_SO=supercontig / SO=protein_coding / is_pseudo=false
MRWLINGFVVLFASPILGNAIQITPRHLPLESWFPFGPNQAGVFTLSGLLEFCFACWNPADKFKAKLRDAPAPPAISLPEQLRAYAVEHIQNREPPARREQLLGEVNQMLDWLASTNDSSILEPHEERRLIDSLSNEHREMYAIVHNFNSLSAQKEKEKGERKKAGNVEETSESPCFTSPHPVKDEMRAASAATAKTFQLMQKGREKRGGTEAI